MDISKRKPYVALIPAYKPSGEMLALLAQLRELEFNVVVVDDGSGDPYAHLFRESESYGAVLHHAQNAGKGRALKTGLSYVADKYPQGAVVVTVDADGQHTPPDVLAVCRRAEANPRAMVMGSRRLKGHVPLRSRFGNSVTRLVYRVATGVRVYDTQTGLRAFNVGLIPSLLEIPGERYEYEMNVLLRLAKARVPILEEEIETIYIDDNASSHFHAVRDSFRIYKEILKFSASSLVGFLVDYAVYGLLLLAGVALSPANVIARVVSASVNFTLNRRLVFGSRERLWRAALKYALLALCILIGNTLVLNLLVNTAGMNRMLAKALTELCFFVISWLLQRLVVFRKIGKNQ